MTMVFTSHENKQYHYPPEGASLQGKGVFPTNEEREKVAVKKHLTKCLALCGGRKNEREGGEEERGEMREERERERKEGARKRKGKREGERKGRGKKGN